MFLYSKADELASFERIERFAGELGESGADVRLRRWDGSDHVGGCHDKHLPSLLPRFHIVCCCGVEHLREHPEEYALELGRFLSHSTDTWRTTTRQSQSRGRSKVSDGFRDEARVVGGGGVATDFGSKSFMNTESKAGGMEEEKGGVSEGGAWSGEQVPRRMAKL